MASDVERTRIVYRGLVRLRGEHFELLLDAVLAAYPKQNELERFVVESLDKESYLVAGTDYRAAVMNLITAAEAGDWVATLVDALRRDRPDHAGVRAVALALGGVS